MKKKSVFARLEKKLLKRKDVLLKGLEERHEDVNDWLKSHKKDIRSLRDSFTETAATSVATGVLLLASSSLPLKSIASSNPIEASLTQTIARIDSSEDISAVLAEQLEKEISGKVKDLTREEKDKITQILTQTLGLNVKSSLDGFELNTNYGNIGGEQHLYRYPGDSLLKHVHNIAEWFMYGPAGIAPNRGAWGYFPNEEFERYYVAVQTFLSPSWKTDPKMAYDWFKFRKVLVINPKTGQAVVAVIGDSGPAEWTGKVYGGSPEVMHYIGLAGGPRKGAVLMFFIDEQGKNIPLGPVTKKVTF